ncbi:MAG: hypothetical protein JNL52_15650 [Flavobacteriales bacterium]|nr:hypothetical protein [Flavobacteriales bacterium]
MNRRRIGILLILAVAVALGAVRDFLLVNLNYQIDFVEHHRHVSYAHSLFRGWTEGLGLGALVRLKWALAVAMSASMLVLCLGMARLVFGDHRYRMVLVIGFGAVGLLALVLQVLSAQVPQLYGVSVKLLHLLQYPVVLFLLWAAALLPGRRTE